MRKIAVICGLSLVMLTGCNPAHLEMVSHLLNQKRRATRAKDKPAIGISPEPDGHGRQIAAHGN